MTFDLTKNRTVHYYLSADEIYMKRMAMQQVQMNIDIKILCTRRRKIGLIRF